MASTPSVEIFAWRMSRPASAMTSAMRNSTPEASTAWISRIVAVLDASLSTTTCGSGNRAAVGRWRWP
jgi:hypothetical protein